MMFGVVFGQQTGQIPANTSSSGAGNHKNETSSSTSLNHKPSISNSNNYAASISLLTSINNNNKPNLNPNSGELHSQIAKSYFQVNIFSRQKNVDIKTKYFPEKSNQ